MKKNLMLKIIAVILCFFVGKIWAQQQIIYDPSPVLTKIRSFYDSKNYKAIFALLSHEVPRHPHELGWFYDVMLAESAYYTNNIATLKTMLPQTLDYKYLIKSMEQWKKQDNRQAALLLSNIQEKSPSLAYLIGKMYYSIGKTAEGAGYFSLASEMSEAPYGKYYYGLSLLGTGRFSAAVSAFENVLSELSNNEPQLRFQAQMQLARAYFGNENFSQAYDLAITLYQQSPSKIIDVIDPGLILTAMDKNMEAQNFWKQALKQQISGAQRSRLLKKLNYNKRLVDPTYPKN